MSAPDRPSALVVEDDALIRMELAENLERAGFRTLEAASAEDAIRVLEGNSDIRVVFTDIEMPGTMDGMALSHYVRHRWPPTIIILSSGRQRPAKADMPSSAEFLTKPYATHELETIIRHIRRQLDA